MSSNPLISLVKDLDEYIANLPLAKKLNTMSVKSRDAMLDLVNSTNLMSNYVYAYVTSDDLKIKASSISASIEILKEMDNKIMLASDIDLINAIDVAHLSAIVDSIRDRIGS